MAKNIYGPGPHKTFVATAGAAIAAGDFIKRSSTKWIPATDGDEAEAYAVTGASGDTVEFVACDESGLEAAFTGSLAVNAVAYVAGAQAVDGGSQNNKSCGLVTKVCPWDSTKNIVKLHFRHVETTHA